MARCGTKRLCVLWFPRGDPRLVSECHDSATFGSPSAQPGAFYLIKDWCEKDGSAQLHLRAHGHTSGLVSGRPAGTTVRTPPDHSDDEAVQLQPPQHTLGSEFPFLAGDPCYLGDPRSRHQFGRKRGKDAGAGTLARSSAGTFRRHS
jgi:hypothetical protein